MQKLSVVTTFSGIGMQERGLLDTSLFDIEVLATSDIDKEAILSYAAIHCGLTEELVQTYSNYPSRDDMVKELTEKNIGYDVNKKKPYDWQRIANRKDKTILCKYWLAQHLANNLGDINLVSRLPKCDLLTFSFPCQSISIAGKQHGIKAKETRSGLIYEIVRLLDVAKEYDELPKILLLENVAALVSKKFIGDFETLNAYFDTLGYNVYWKIINAKDTGVPQNRPRVFGIYIRKDIDTYRFKFPLPFDNGLRIKDVLEEHVDTKYYLSQQVQDRFRVTDESFAKNIVGTTKPDYRKIGQRDNVYQMDGIMGALVATDYKQPKQILVEETNDVKVVGCVDIANYDSLNRVYDANGIAPTLDTMQGGHRQPKIIKEIANGNKLLNMIISENEIDDKEACDCTLNEPHIRDIANCITARYDNGVSHYKQVGTAIVEKKDENMEQHHYYIRKLTPKECFSLMGLTKEDCQRCYDVGISDASLYKEAGNGIVTTVIKALGEQLYKALWV